MKNFILCATILLLGILSISSCGGGLCSGECKSVSSISPQDGNFQHVAFVTSIRVSGNIGGLDGADKICQQFAAEGSKTKEQGGTWKAVLSDSSTSSKERIFLKSGTPVLNTNNEKIVENSDSFWSGKLGAPIQFDQNGIPMIEKLEVWSGTLADGSKASGPNLVTSCTDWTDGTTITNGGVVGMLNAIDKSWIESEDFIGCAPTDEKARLYCINSI